MNSAYEEAKQRYVYDDDLGGLRWRHRPSYNSKRPAGGIAGYLANHGRWQVRISGKDVLRSRVVWLMHHGWVPDTIDHINRVRSDDRIANLRPATRSEQNANQAVRSNNTSGFRGVYWDARKRRWAARIKVRGERWRLGTYATAEEAFAAVDAVGRVEFGEYWNAA